MRENGKRFMFDVEEIENYTLKNNLFFHFPTTSVYKQKPTFLVC